MMRAPVGVKAVAVACASIYIKLLWLEMDLMMGGETGGISPSIIEPPSIPHSMP